MVEAKKSFMTKNNHFRANVGSVIINSKYQVLAFERADHKDAWQFPQGGIDEDESPKATAERELFEETAIQPTQELTYLDEYPEWIVYELPEEKRSNWHGRGQAQKWFLFRVNDDAIRVDLSKAKDREFVNWRWMDMNELLEIVVDFRKPTYTKLRDWLTDRKDRS
jgi:putative (di)nucleoside polyphosphate hydrolase